MRLRKIPGIGEKLVEEYGTLLVDEAKNPRGNWQNYFQNPAPVFLEIGMAAEIYFLYGEEIPGA